MPLQHIRLRPGIVHNGTNMSNEGGWWHGDKVRFWFGLPQKLGGWVKMLNATFKGITRLLIAWNAFNPNNEMTGIGTSKRFYVVTAGTEHDITPIVYSLRLPGTNNLHTINGSTEIVIDHANHGLRDGQTIRVFDATSVGGIPDTEINAIHEVRVIDALTYKIKVTTPATSTTAGGGAAAGIEAYVYAGPDVAVIEGGWGAPPWGGGVGPTAVGWGTSYASQVLTQHPGLWSADIFGNDLFINPRGGAIYYWAYSNGAGVNQRAVELSTLATAGEKPWVPKATNYIVTNDLYNFLLAYGVNPDQFVDDLDPLFIRWSDQNNFFDWEPKTTNQAGGIRLSSGSMILCALKTRQETIIFTDTSIYAQQYIGPPLVFSFSLISNNVSLMGPNAAAVFNGVVYWMGAGRFYKFDGMVQPLVCTVNDVIFEDIDLVQAWQVTCGYNERFREIIWFYCSKSSPNQHPDRYVIYNPFEETWVYGTMDRSSWQYSAFRSLPMGAKPEPVMDVWGDATYDSKLLLHEVGNDDQSGAIPAPIVSFIESSDFDIGEGHQFSLVSKVIPDINFANSAAVNPIGHFGLDVRNQSGGKYRDPGDLTVVRSTTQPVQQYTEQLNFRLRGRQVKLSFGSEDLGVAWQFGPPSLDIRPDGRR